MLLECQGVTVKYGDLVAVEDVDLVVEPRTTIGVVGPNGAGKTSLLRGICGLERCARGSIRFDGEDVTGRPTPDLVGRGISLVPAARQLFPHLTVEKNLWLGAHIHTGSRAGRRRSQEELEGIYEMFPILRERRRQSAGSLSGGQQQMVAIGRALMARPRLLVLDEPSLGLAQLILVDIFAALRRLVAESEVTVVLVEQNAELTVDFVDHVYLLDAGRVVKSGATADLERDDLAQAYLGGTT
jgi:branched-chain amino acid transport system ATP-binding protein